MRIKLQVASSRLQVSRRSQSACETFNFQPATSNRSAFSLVEVLIVVSLLSLIVLALMAVFSSTQKAFRSAVTQTDVLEGGRATMELITSDLRRMTPSGGVSNGTVNFFTRDNSYSPAMPYLPLMQSLPGGNLNRMNVLNYFFVLGRENTKWTGVGYAVNVTNSSPLYPLYRFYAEINITQSPRTLFDLFTNTVYQGQWTNSTLMSHVMDGVIQLRVRAYDRNGFWLTNGYTFNQPNQPVNVRYFSPVWQRLDEVGMYMYSNTVPDAVELELGVLEDSTLARAESLPNDVPQPAPNDRRTQFLQKQSGAVHLFRQRVSIPNVDPAAYQ